MGIVSKFLNAAEEAGILEYDSRPDLKEDHPQWEWIIREAQKVSADLAGVLDGLRCGGTRLKKVKGQWVLRPDVDPTGKLAWESVEEYEKMRDEYLMPHKDRVVELLRRMKEVFG